MKIKYNKEKPGRVLMGKSPRDLQLLQGRNHQVNTKLVPKVKAETANNIDYVDMNHSQHLSLSEVRKKIDDAIRVVRDEERTRYKSGLQNLNKQLKQTRNELIKANDTIKQLTEELQTKDLEITMKDKELEFIKQKLHSTEEKLDLISQELYQKDIKIIELQTVLQNNYSSDIINQLESKLDRLYEKIADGSIGPFVGSKISKPELEDKIFIDPLDEIERQKEKELSTHIDVKRESTKNKRNIEEDVSKLRKLLKL